MKITISGLAAAGTSSVGKRLAEVLNYKFVSAGDFFREMAKERGMTIYELAVKQEKDGLFEFDDLCDQKTVEYGKVNDNFICDGWLSWLFIPDAFKIKLVCPDEVRFRRVAERENLSIEEATEKTLARAERNWKRWSKLYGCNQMPDEKFDLIIDSSRMNVEEIVGEVRKTLTA